MGHNFISLVLLALFLLAGCSEQKTISLTGSDNDVLDKSHIAAIESRITGENKLILEKDNAEFHDGETIIIAMGLNNILPVKKEFRIILSGGESMMLSENSYSIIYIKEDDFEILPLIINIPDEIEKDTYMIVINAEFKEGKEEWKAYDQKVFMLTKAG